MFTCIYFQDFREFQETGTRPSTWNTVREREILKKRKERERGNDLSEQ